MDKLFYFVIWLIIAGLCVFSASTIADWFGWPGWVAWPLGLSYVAILACGVVSWADSGTDNGHDEEYYGGTD